MLVKRLIIVAGLVASLAAPAAAMQAQTAGCGFILGFATLDSLIPKQVGTCIDNQAFAANGDALQHTSGGLLVWRKADNWTAFTDGYRTWINGPTGLAQRLNTGPLFPWENPTPPAPPAPAAPTPTPVPSYPYLSKGVNTPPTSCGSGSRVPCVDSAPNSGTQYVQGHILDKNGGAVSGIIVQALAYGNIYNAGASEPDGTFTFTISSSCPIEHRIYQMYVVDGSGHQSSDMHTVTYDNCNTAGEFHFDFVRQS